MNTHTPQCVQKLREWGESNVKMNDTLDIPYFQVWEIVKAFDTAPKLADALRELLFVSQQSLIVPNAYCEGCDTASNGRRIVHKQGCVFVRAPAALAEWDAQ